MRVFLISSAVLTKNSEAIAFSSLAGEVIRPPRAAESEAALEALFSNSHPPPPVTMESQLPLYKHRSWSPDLYRDEAWDRRKGNSKNRRSKSVTDEDLDELKACIELGFSFDSPEDAQRLSNTLPALGLYYAVNKNYSDAVGKSSPSLSTISDCDTHSPIGSPHTIFGPGDNPQTIKTRLRHWAQVVACSVRQYLADDDGVTKISSEPEEG